MAEETTTPQEMTPPVPRRRRWLWVLGGVVAVALLGYALLLGDLPSDAEIRNYRPETTARSASAVDWNKPRLHPVRVWVPLSRIAKTLQQAVVISEDDTFYQHDGVNFKMMREAFLVNWRKGRYVRGASTITMQLARNAFLHRRKTLLRKVREIILARRIEKVLTKNQILELYLNLGEWGENLYGAEAAAHHYFGKPAASLSLDQSTLLASLLPNPKYFNPFKRPRSCRRMQERVLNLMLGARAITPEQQALAMAAPMQLRGAVSEQAVEVAAVDSAEEAKYPAFFSTPGDSAQKSQPLHADSLLPTRPQQSLADTLLLPR